MLIDHRLHSHQFQCLIAHPVRRKAMDGKIKMKIDDPIAPDLYMRLIIKNGRIYRRSDMAVLTHVGWMPRLVPHPPDTPPPTHAAAKPRPKPRPIGVRRRLIGSGALRFALKGRSESCPL